MKKIVSLILILSIIFSSVRMEIYAENSSFTYVKVIDGYNGDLINGISYNVIKKENDLLFAGEDLASISGFEYDVSKGIATFTRGYKEVRVNIKKNTYTALDNLSDYTFENKVVYVNGRYYFSGAEIIPWLNVMCISENGKLYITRNEVSYWDLICTQNPGHIDL